MATVNATGEKILGGEAFMFTWTPITNADVDGAPITAHEYGDRTVQVVGTFNGATAVMQGSNDGSVWASLTDPQGNALSFAAAGLEQVMETPRYTRVLTSGGGGSQSLTVTLFCRRTLRR